MKTIKLLLNADCDVMLTKDQAQKLQWFIDKTLSRLKSQMALNAELIAAGNQLAADNTDRARAHWYALQQVGLNTDIKRQSFIQGYLDACRYVPVNDIIVHEAKIRADLNVR